MKKVEYVRCNDLKFINLNGLYNDDYTSLKNLDYTILKVIEVESPVSLNTLKARLREAMEIKKISQKALDIINERLDYYGIVRTILEQFRQEEYILRLGNIAISRLFSIAMIVIGVVVFVCVLIQAHKKKVLNEKK